MRQMQDAQRYDEVKKLVESIYKGFELIHKAAVQGYGPAIKTVGDCYNHGVAVPEDSDKAMQWYETFLKDNYDPDLVQKVALMKMLKLQEEDENEGDNIIYN